MMDITITCPHCNTTNRIVETGTDAWETVGCSSCRMTLGTLHELAVRQATDEVRQDAGLPTLVPLPLP